MSETHHKNTTHILNKNPQANIERRSDGINRKPVNLYKENMK